MHLRHLLCRIVIALALLAGPLAAEDLSPPSGPPLLSVSGMIAHSNDNGVARFDLAMLEALDQRSFSTHTLWTDGPQRFTGVPLLSLMAAVGAGGSRIRAMAANDYAVDISLGEPQTDSAIVAYRTNGALMSLRDKGPLWIVYPYDSAPAFQTEQIYARSIWQLDRIEVTD